MTDFSDSKSILTVSQISHRIRNCLESQFPSLWIKGELSNFISHSSGHWYFSLKDDKAQIKGLMFRGQNQKLSFRPQTGEEVVVYGQISVYPPRGNYQIICHEMEIVGSGLLQRQFEQIKQKLKSEGLFDPGRKKKIPLFPRHIALLTSPTGAAVRDILRVLRRRFKPVKVTVVPCLVQGDQAPQSLLKGLRDSEKLGADVLIVGRGGGSMEDLWAFNDEALARAIANHPIPVISAVGHEIDFTICDFSADLRAPTPSAAAELAVQNMDDILEKIYSLKKRMIQHIKLTLRFAKDKLLSLEKSLSRPDKPLYDLSQRLDELASRLSQSLRRAFETAKERLQAHEKTLESLSPQKIMERGFSVVTNEAGRAICASKELKINDSISIHFFKGRAKASITQKE